MEVEFETEKSFDPGKNQGKFGSSKHPFGEGFCLDKSSTLPSSLSLFSTKWIRTGALVDIMGIQ